MPDTSRIIIETTATGKNSPPSPADAETIFLRADLAAAKTSHYAARESGDTVELVERPDGGFTLVLVDGQGHGFPAKLLSLQLTAKAVALIKEGVRDGAVARAVHDYLHAYRGGRVSATLDLLTLDLGTNSILISRNADVPGVVSREGVWALLPTASGPIGVRRHARPAIDQFDLALGVQVALFTDGIAHAGERYGAPLDVCAALSAGDAPPLRAQTLADTLLSAAIAADRGLPNDDMTVIALTITARAERAVTRHLNANVPLIQRRRDG
jgi:serine phosphatase RsbU (regulator of sigma subunit)